MAQSVGRIVEVAVASDRASGWPADSDVTLRYFLCVSEGGWEGRELRHTIPNEQNRVRALDCRVSPGFHCEDVNFPSRKI